MRRRTRLSDAQQIAPRDVRAHGMSIQLSAIGDSLTYGTSFCGVTSPWPTLLGRNTGQYNVLNFGAVDPQGKSEITTNSYKDTPQFTELMESDPTIVTIMLGTFDSTANFRESDFTNSLRGLIGRVQRMETLPHVVLLIPPPVWTDGAAGGVRAGIVENQLVPAITRLAHKHGCTVVDLQAAFIAAAREKLAAAAAAHAVAERAADEAAAVVAASAATAADARKAAAALAVAAAQADAIARASQPYMEPPTAPPPPPASPPGLPSPPPPSPPVYSRPSCSGYSHRRHKAFILVLLY